MSSSRADSKGRIRIVSLGAAAFFMLAIGSQAWVQTLGSGGLQEKAKKSKRFVVTNVDRPKRGEILSADGKVLARDDSIYALHVNFKRVPKSPGFYLDLGQSTGMSGAEIREHGSREGGDVVWPATLNLEAKRRVEAVKSKWRADGLSADSTGQRQYPLGAAASSIIGLLGGSETAKGVEKGFAEAIAGKAGESRGLVDRTGAFLPMRMEGASTQRVDGKDIQLTIDSDLQQVAFEAVKRAVEKHNAESGVAIAMVPETGDILAMANWPTFDPRTGQGPDGEPADVNPNIMSRWEPGSTMKVLTLAKAIEDGVVGTGWTGVCRGTINVGPYRASCDAHGGSGAHGAVNLEKAIAVSCNVSAAQWALKVGYDPYRQYVADLGFLEPADVGLPGETSGRIPKENVARTHDLMCWGFGQSMGVPPLTLAASFCALGNDGLWMKPRLVKSIGGKENPVREGEAVLSPETTRQVMAYMEQVFASDRGTAKAIRIPGYRLAGKTGTAQRLGRKGGGYVSNFVGFVPADSPKAMILVMVDHPRRGGYYGSIVAGPVFDELARAVIRKYAIVPNSGTPQRMNSRPAPTVDIEVRR